MNSFILRLVILTAVLTAYSSLAHAANSCDFDPSGIALPALAKDSVKVSDWDKQKLEYRAILRDGSVFFVKYWACDHFGLSAEMTVSNDKERDEALKGLVKAVAVAVLKPKLRTALEDLLSKQQHLTVGTSIDVP